mgnify:CR=1 FL=1
MVRDILDAVLRTAGFEPLCADDAGQAEQLFAADPQSFAAVIVDRRLGSESGLELIARLRTRRRELPVLLVSGYHERPAELDRIEGPEVALLAKPFRAAALLTTLRGMLPAP